MTGTDPRLVARPAARCAEGGDEAARPGRHDGAACRARRHRQRRGGGRHRRRCRPRRARSPAPHPASAPPRCPAGRLDEDEARRLVGEQRARTARSRRLLRPPGPARSRRPVARRGGRPRPVRRPVNDVEHARTTAAPAARPSASSRCHRGRSSSSPHGRPSSGGPNLAAPSAFYTPPVPLPAGPPGTIVRDETIDDAGDGRAGVARAVHVDDSRRRADRRLGGRRGARWRSAGRRVADRRLGARDDGSRPPVRAVDRLPAERARTRPRARRTSSPPARS